MKVCVLTSPEFYPRLERMMPGDQALIGPPTPGGSWKPEWLISWGHPKILTPDELAPFEGRTLNIHISYLPWNRGADPNFWSWHDETPKGVTLHQMSSQVDGGGIYAQSEIMAWAHHPMTLASTYQELQNAAETLFKMTWPMIRTGELKPRPQSPLVGSYHRRADRLELPSFDWDTPVDVIRAYGMGYRHGRKDK